MTPHQLEHFRHKLEEQRDALGPRIADGKARAEESIERTRGDVGDVGDASVHDLEVYTELTVAEERTHQLEEINEALSRIELGEYGVCETCGQPIELDRLEAIPATRLCKADARRADTRKPATL